MKKNPDIPVITKLVATGDPELKAKALAESKHSNTLQLDELNQRIDELESAIGQDKSGPIGRAFAIRAESSRKPDSKRKVTSKPSSRKKMV